MEFNKKIMNKNWEISQKHSKIYVLSIEEIFYYISYFCPITFTKSEKVLISRQ